MHEMMDKPLDINWLAAGFNSIANCAVNHTRTREMGTGRVMEQLFGVQLDNRGFASTNRRSPVDFTSQARIISSKYENWNARDYENWLLSEFSKGYEEGLKYLDQMRKPVEPIEIRGILPYWLNT
jgi:hypothetical protein